MGTTSQKAFKMEKKNEMRKTGYAKDRHDVLTQTLDLLVVIHVNIASYPMKKSILIFSLTIRKAES